MYILFIFILWILAIFIPLTLSLLYVPLKPSTQHVLLLLSYLLFVFDPLILLTVLFPTIGGDYLLEHGQLTMGYNTEEKGKSFSTTVGYQSPSVREWGLMGPFLSCNEMIKSSVLCRACVENSSSSKFMTKMSMLCQEQIMLNFPIIPLMLTLSLLPHRSLEEGV